MKYLLLILSVLSCNLASADEKIDLYCYHFRYDDPAGVRNRNDLDPTPFMRIVSGSFQSPYPENQTVHIQQLRPNGSVIATDYATYKIMQEQIQDGRGTMVYSLMLNRIIENTTLNLPRYMDFGLRTAMGDDYRLFDFWLDYDYANGISCFKTKR